MKKWTNLRTMNNHKEITRDELVDWLFDDDTVTQPLAEATIQSILRLINKKENTVDLKLNKGTIQFNKEYEKEYGNP